MSGLISTLVYTGTLILSRHMYLDAMAQGTTGQLMNMFLIMQVVGWGAQFFGHGVFEGRKPALMDNILLTTVAPDFVTIEIMFALGWRKETHEKCQKRIEENIRQLSEGKKSA